MHWKLAQSILAKWKNALQQQEETKSALDELTARISNAWVSEWRQLEGRAMSERGTWLRIYDVADTKGLPTVFAFVLLSLKYFKAPGCAELVLELSQKERKSGVLSGIPELLALGLNLENAQ